MTVEELLEKYAFGVTNFSGVDLSEANLSGTKLSGADLTGATLTGAKLYATSRFGLKTEGITCEWVDLSPTGDRSIIQHFTSVDSPDFFNETSPTIRIIVDADLESEAHFALASAYYQISQQYQQLRQPPSMEIGRRRTVFTFRVDSDAALFPTAYIAILPFKDAATTQRNIHEVVEIIKSEDISTQRENKSDRTKQLSGLIEEARSNATTIKEMQKILEIAEKVKFFQTPTQTILTNSSAQTLIVHDHPNFGKKIINRGAINPSYDQSSNTSANVILPSVNTIVDFVKGFHYIS